MCPCSFCFSSFAFFFYALFPCQEAPLELLYRPPLSQRLPCLRVNKRRETKVETLKQVHLPSLLLLR